MKNKNLRSCLFISYTLILSVLVTAYMGDKIYLLNFYILPILFGAYYFNIYGGVGLAGVGSVLSTYFMIAEGNLIDNAAMISQIVIFFAIGTVGGLFQRENNKLSEYLLKNSLMDKLSGLYNYGYFVKRLAEEVSRADRYKRSLALVMIDIDLFKEYNDKYGHENGNLVISKIASIFKESIRKSDVAFRYGGEEFAIILPETSKNALVIAERIRRLVDQAVFACNAHLTISVGITYYPCQKKSQVNLVARADKALYKAKNGGRNRVFSFEQEEEK